MHNPWPIIGGVAQAIVSDSEFILPELGQAGDVSGSSSGASTGIILACHSAYRSSC